jgi:formylglycine-generating enzyme required for sulfatase activity
MTRQRNVRDVRAQRDVSNGNQVNVANLTRVKALLDQIVGLLQQPQASVRVERDGIAIAGGVHAEGDVTVHNEVHLTPADLGLFGALQQGADPGRREQIYLTRFVLQQTYAQWARGYLPLRGILHPAMRLSDRGDQGISQAGVALDDVRDALTDLDKTRLVILGEPGAGKTTTLHCLALELARERLRDPLLGKLPFRADLFKFTDERQPADFLDAEWRTSGLVETYGQAAGRGQVCFLLDGVNQMPVADRARRIERWAHWANEELPPGNWAVFTCRNADYVTSLRLPEVHVQSLDPDRMQRYFELRFGEERGAELWHDFEQRLHAGDDRFDKLARNPFTLSLLAERCEEGKPFTGSRARLMDDLARRLIEHELEGGRQPERLTADPPGALQAEMEALSRLAFAMQARGEGTSLSRAEASRVKLGEKDQMRLSLGDALDLAAAANVLDCVEGSGGDGVFAFRHHLLQEYFAARELLRRFRASGRLDKYWRVRWRKWQVGPRRLRAGAQLLPPPVTGWEETVVMAVALAGQDACRFVKAVRGGNLPLAGRCLAEAGPQREELAGLTGAVRAALLARQRDPAAHLRARIDAGLALGQVGHSDLTPRPFEFEERSVWAILPPLQPVPAGPFIRGSEHGDKDAYSREYTSEREVVLPAYSVARYSVTNAEYALFVDDGGYREERWWGEVGWQWRQGGPEAHAGAIEDWLAYRVKLREYGVEKAARQFNWMPSRRRFWEEVVQLSEEETQERARRIFDRPFDRPAYWDDRDLSNPGRPVVGVNWYEAAAYCAWLSAVTGREFRLPTEVEWEKAVRGTNGRRYPWGEKFDAAKCNTVEGQVYTTTPVGLYPNGVSPCGLFDGAGNVWEWTEDWYQMYSGGEPSDDFGEKFRAVRGGSWYLDQYLARCAYRFRYVPVVFSDDVGFRVVSPGSISGC